MKQGDDSDFAHVGPGTLAGRYLRRFWQPVYRSADLAAGRPVRLQILSEHFTLYRGDSGEAHLLTDRCPHRQTQLSLGWVEGDAIRCFYHGWLFDEAGQCTQQPAEKASFAAKVRVPAYPVREYLGLIFAYLGEGTAPDFPLYPEMEQSESDLAVNRHIVPCSYFQRIENDLDEAHVHFVHSVSTKQVGLDEIPEIRVAETEYGILREGIRSGTGVNLARRVAHFMMPNINMVDLPPTPDFAYWTVHVAWRVPQDDVTAVTFSLRLIRGDGTVTGPRRLRPSADPEPNPLYLSEEILAGRLRIQDVSPDYPGLFVVEDNVALAGQGRITDRSQDWLGQSDKGVILLRRIWHRELAALAAGRPVKQWRRPAQRMGLAINEITETAAL